MSENQTAVQQDWQPIETAPRDCDVLLFLGRGNGRFLRVGRYSRSGFGWVAMPGHYGCNPTHWMPLPPPPTAGSPQSREESQDASTAATRASAEPPPDPSEG